MSGKYPFTSATDFPEEASQDEIDAARSEAERAFDQRLPKCKRCGQPLTWAAQRKQYGRLCKRGIEASIIKTLVPQCHSCLTIALKEVKS
jgi:hypothetical protein